MFTFLLLKDSSLRTQVNVSISKQSLIGLWQEGSPLVGNGYAESFSFFSNGTFVYQHNPFDDLRGVSQLKGKYRLDKGGLYLTILFRVERVGGNILTGAAGTDEYLFVLDNYKIKQVSENHPKELDPLFIEKVNVIDNKVDFYINNRHYYKVSTDPNKINDQ
jgi:hypothetical protein